MLLVCGGELTTPVGTLTSPNYPGLYAHSRRCTWYIRVPEGRKVTLTFNDMDLQDPSGAFCFNDFVDVRILLCCCCCCCFFATFLNYFVFCYFFKLFFYYFLKLLDKFAAASSVG